MAFRIWPSFADAPVRRASRRLLLFGKVPAPGGAKTRLAPLFGPAAAARLYEAFLEDTAARVGAVAGAEAELWLEPAGAPGREAGERLGRRLGLAVRWQEGEGLGERLGAAFARAFEEGAGAAVAVGSDHPTLPPSRLEEALDALETADVVVGPSEDGGYYALGLRRAAWPRAAELFRGVPWSTSDVLERTRQAIASLGLAARELEEWYDVDEPEDLERLARDLEGGSRTAAALARLTGR